MEKKLRYHKIYAIENKGSLKFVDFLTYCKSTKKAIFINNAQIDEDISLKQRKVPFMFFQNTLMNLHKKGYEITTVDGAGERVKKEEIFEALDCKYSKEKLALLAKERPELYEYYSLKRIRVTLRKYVHGELDSVYLVSWCRLYLQCLLESYSESRVKIEERVFIKLIASCLTRLSVVTSDEISLEDKYVLVKKVYEEIKKFDTDFNSDVKTIKKHERKLKHVKGGIL